MTLSLTLRSLASVAAVCAVALAESDARAQATPLAESITIGAFAFRPILDVRLRGEYRRSPFDTGGNVYASTAVFYESPASTLPPLVKTQPAIVNDYFVAERLRLGLAVDRGPVTAAVTLQDARVLGSLGSDAVISGSPAQQTPGSFGPSEGYLDVHTQTGRHVFLRVGRQRVTWGDGRLVGSNDWSATGRSLDAARLGFQVGDVDIQAMAVMLSPPGQYTRTSALQDTTKTGSGAQLYGIDVIWHRDPALNVEVTSLARIVRDPAPTTLTPSDTVVIDGRISGDRRGFRYAAEGAYELGRTASYGATRDVRAFALAATASWETSLPWHLTFITEGAYASGDKGDGKGAVKRFDPILPDERTTLSPMGLWAWSNVMEIGGSLGVKPIEQVAFLVGYRYAALAQGNGRWTNAALVPIGAAPNSTAQSLGHEIDAAVSAEPWKALAIKAGYGLFVCGSGAEAILTASARPATLQHAAYLQATVRVP